MSRTSRLVSVVGLGYVGLPVAMAFGKKGRTIGFDVNSSRVEELRRGVDRNGDMPPEAFVAAQVLFTGRPEDLRQADFHIVAVPTPVDEANTPDLTLLYRASETVGRILKKGDIVVYESTVYPGVTEEECLPILESASGLRGGRDFTVGYSPERINPGDRQHTFANTRKVVSGQDAATLETVAAMYESVVEAGVYRASSIAVAEAEKVIENTQRDLNIALMNELALIFHRMGIDTLEVLEAAGTKWNFLPFRPGLVGGHCIGVDPYYLTHKAEMLDYIPQVVLAGRRINDSMGRFVAQQTIKEMIQAGHAILDSRVTVLGLTFKEDYPDIRNSRVVDLIREFQDYGVKVQVHDPLADPADVEREYGIVLTAFEKLEPAAAVVVAVAHACYRRLRIEEFRRLMSAHPVLVDVKGIVDRQAAGAAGIRLWRL